MDSKIKMTQDTQYEPIKIAIKTQINQKQNSNTTIWNPTQNCTRIVQEQLNKMHRLEFPNSTPIQNEN